MRQGLPHGDLRLHHAIANLAIYYETCLVYSTKLYILYIYIYIYIYHGLRAVAGIPHRHDVAVLEALLGLALAPQLHLWAAYS